MKNIFLLVLSLSALCFLSACGASSSSGSAGVGSQIATHFTVTAPATASAGTPLSITVVALDASNRIVIGYFGTVRFTSSDAQAVLPGNSTLANGTQNFSATLASVGSQTITATDTATTAITGSSSPIQVATSSTPPPAINKTTPPNGGLNLPFDFQFTAVGGLPPFTWMETGALPAGLTFSSQGLLSGTPTESGSFPITVTVQDSLGRSASPLVVTIQILPHGFQATGDMGTERAGHTATLLQNGKVLIAGGFNSTAVLATAQLFDPASGTFTPTGAMTTPRFSHTATLLANGKVLVAGGSPSLGDLSGGDNSDDLSTAELFDPATGAFTATGPMSEPRSEHTATLLANGTVLLAGGAAGNVAELFDPSTGSFTATGELTVGGRWGCTATLLKDGTVLIAGGRDSEDVFDGFPLNEAELFNPVTGTFTATGSMTQFRYAHTATLLNNGQVLLTGGFNGTPVQDAELFDPTSGSFSRTGSMGSPRADHTATLLNDGTVLVAGAFSFNGAFASVEVFDPTTGQFSPTGSMDTARFLHTSTRLTNGEVLVTGGQSTITIPEVFASSAELYK